jgi:hypothetical protein
MIERLWHPDPSDYHTATAHGRPSRLPPEKRLMRAVLEDALLLITDRPHTDPNRGMALAWVRSESRRGLYSFESVCETLNLHAGAMRSGILALALRQAPERRQRRRRKSEDEDAAA